MQASLINIKVDLEKDEVFVEVNDGFYKNLSKLEKVKIEQHTSNVMKIAKKSYQRNFVKDQD